MKHIPSFFLAFIGLLSCIIATAEENTVVIPVEFENVKLSCSREKIKELVDSASAYLERQLHGTRKMSFDLAETARLTKPLEYYGANSTDRRDALAQEAVVEACLMIAPNYDFSSIDNVVLITAGPSEAYGSGEDFFWPAQARLSDFNIPLKLNGRKIDSFGICPELGPDGQIAGIGDFCHEYGHFLGLMDLYDTDGDRSGGTSSSGLDTLSLMALGSRNGNGHRPAPLCAVDYDQLKEFSGTKLSKGEFSLKPIEHEGEFAIMDYMTSGKYCLLENRNGKLLISLADKSNLFAGLSSRMKRNLTAIERWRLNEVNCNPQYQCATIVWNGSDGFFAGDSLVISNIRKEGDLFSFNVLEPIVISDATIYQDAISVNWKSELKSSVIAASGIGWWTGTEKLTERAASRLEDGSFHFTIDSLKPATSYNISIHISTTEGHSFSRSLTAGTLARREDASPFIMLDSAGRNEDGSFQRGSKLPLRLRNGAGVIGAVWTFNGTEIHTDADGMWEIPSSGKLQARLTMLDGSVEVIVKQINVR